MLWFVKLCKSFVEKKNLGRAIETLHSLHSPFFVRFMKTRTPRGRLIDDDINIFKQNFISSFINKNH